MIATKIKDIIAKAANISVDQINLEHPELEDHGDYSTNIALVLKGGPKLANELAPKIIGDMIEKTEVAGPGFINIWLKQEYLLQHLKESANMPNIGEGEVVVVEYSSPNIAKPFGIGHLRSTIIGQALYNIYKSLGYNTIGDNHLGDWGTQFGKLLFMVDLRKPGSLTIDELEKLYIEFHTHPEWEEEGQKWFKKLETGDETARKVWQECVDISLTEFDRVYKLLNVQIDNAFGEASYEHLMQEVVEDAKKISIKSEGATIIEVPKLSTPLMLLKSDGGTTYATRDLATIKFRQKKWSPKMVIYEVGGEQTLHFQQVFAVAKMLGYVSDTSSLIHTKHGLYLDTDGKKFSTRKGKTIKLDEVLLEAIEKAKNLGSEDKITAQAVGIGAIKYFDLSHAVPSDIVFDWDKILSLDGNSGPYLQYTYARTQSILRKIEPNSTKQGDVALDMEELRILRYIYRYSEVVEQAAIRYAPNLVANFLYELAQRFNTFYNKDTILGNNMRLELTARVGEVLKSGLNLLGIEALERM